MENMVSEAETAPESDIRFPVVLRGYDRRQVDEYVRVAEKRLDRHEKARRMAERKLAKAQVPTPRSGETDPAHGLGKRIEKILEVAKSEAEAIKDQAREESAKILAAAEKTATDADDARAETELAAATEARLIISRAEEEATIIRSTHQAALTELGQIAAILTELRRRYAGEPEAETNPESEADSTANAEASTEPESAAESTAKTDTEGTTEAKADSPSEDESTAGSEANHTIEAENASETEAERTIEAEPTPASPPKAKPQPPRRNPHPPSLRWPVRPGHGETHCDRHQPNLKWPT
jgi:DivIVA domain-containing protein